MACTLQMCADVSSNPVSPDAAQEDADFLAEGTCTTSCPLCAIDDVETEHAGAVLSNNAFVRRIMAQELIAFGTKPDNVIYNNIARMYNRHIHGPMKESNLECTRWTGKMVKTHFDLHVQFVPRRVAGKVLRRLERIAQILDTEVDMRTTGDIPAGADELVDTKLVTKQCNIAKTTMAVLKDLRTYVKEDMVYTGARELCRSVELGETSVTEAKQMLDRAALIQSAAGGGDRPTASDLFEE